MKMMNNRTDKRTVGAFLIVCAVCTVVFCCMAAVTRQAYAREMSEEEKLIRSKIEEAVAEAKKTGRTTINIYLDETPGIVQTGDLVQAHITLRLADGSLVYTTVERLAHDPGQKRSSGYYEPERFVPQEFLAGEETDIPGIGDAVLGMKPEEKKMINLSPDDAAEQGKESRVNEPSGAAEVDPGELSPDKDMILEVEVVSLLKATSLRNRTIPWVEDHDQGMEIAGRDNKPSVLVLFSRDCSWCRKLFSETMNDPKIKALDDRFVWIRVDSSQHDEFKALYGQDGYPMIVVMSPCGDVIRKISGYVNATKLRNELRECLRRAS